MHKVEIGAEIVSASSPAAASCTCSTPSFAKRTALIVIDMQNASSPGRTDGSPCRPRHRRPDQPPRRRAAQARRHRDLDPHQNAKDGGDWTGFFDAFIAPGRRADAAAALSAGSELQKLCPDSTVEKGDLRVAKNRYSAFIKSDLERSWQRGIDTLLIAGTKTNVCCECTARDAMMLDYKVVLLSDCTAALSDDEQRATLENVIQQFGDVLTADEALALLDKTTPSISRRRAIAAAGGAVLASALPWLAPAAHGAEGPVATRPIPSSGERLPIVGIGTAVIFDYQNDPAKQAARREVIRTLIAGGGRLIDTAPGYGSAEDRLGEIVAELGVRDKLFLATKFSFDLPRAEADASLRRLAAPAAHRPRRPDAGVERHRWRLHASTSCASGRKRAFAATSASPPARCAATTRWRRCSRGRSRISSR